MNQQVFNFLQLIRFFLKDIPPRLRQPNWDEIYSLASLHNLVPVVYDAARELPEFSDAPVSLREKFRQTTIYQSSTQFLRTEMLFSVYDAFLENGLKPLLLKGLICRNLYKSPDLRVSCDEDLWIQKEDLEKYDNLLKGLGYQPDLEDLKEKLDEVQELTYSNGTLSLEMHINPFGTENELRVRMNRLFDHSYEKSVRMEIQGHTIYTLNATEHFLFLFTHLFKHFLLGGVGIRQILDQLLFLETYRSEIDFERINDGISELHGQTFYAAILNLGVKYLGFTAIAAPPLTKELEPLIDDLIESGCFGNHSKAQHYSAAYILAESTQEDTKRPGIITLLFPPASRIYYSYPFLIRRPWLLPAAWFLRFIKFGKELMRSDKTLVNDSIRRGKKRISLIKKYRDV